MSSEPMPDEVCAAALERALVLARLRVEEPERERFRGEFARVLAAFEVLRQVDVDGVTPLFTPAQPEHPLREDRAGPSLPRDELLRNAPDPRGEFFGAPKTVGGEP